MEGANCIIETEDQVINLNIDLQLVNIEKALLEIGSEQKDDFSLERAKNYILENEFYLQMGKVNQVIGLTILAQGIKAFVGEVWKLSWMRRIAKWRRWFLRKSRYF